jgi:hypothetical protein
MCALCAVRVCSAIQQCKVAIVLATRDFGRLNRQSARSYSTAWSTRPIAHSLSRSRRGAAMRERVRPRSSAADAAQSVSGLG